MSRLVLLSSLLTVSSAAHAFSITTVATKGCHERITLDAARAAGLVPTADVTVEDRALLATLPFNVEGAWDRGTLALLIGLRDPDFHGVAASDFVRLSEVHLSPVLQQEHCLRAPGEDEGHGDQEALVSCRAFIANELRLAANAAPGETEMVLVALTNQTTSVQLASAEFHLGRALHALQDGFAHTLRTEDFGTVRSVFNYVDPLVGSGYQRSRDGHPHLSEYDACDEGTAAARARVATEASREVIVALTQQSVSAEARMSTAERVLDRVLEYQPACDDGAAWCTEADALLVQTLPPAVGCNVSPAQPLSMLVLLVLFAVARRAQLRRRLTVFGAVAAMALPVAARADEAQQVTETSTASAAPFALRLRPAVSLGVSAERGAGVVAVGLRLPLQGRFELYGDVEFNPWFDALAGKVSAGALNSVVGATVRWASVGAVELRSGLGLGVSVLLHDTVAARAGAIGPFAQLGIINVLIPGPGSTRFELRPDAVLSIPSVRGVPLVYHQYRMVLSMRF